jgi:hypothetical protein
MDIGVFEAWSTGRVRRKALAAAIGLILLVDVGVLVVANLLDGLSDFGGGGPHRADFVDQLVGTPESSSVARTGDLILRSLAVGVSAQPLDRPAAVPVPLFDARYLGAVAPDGRHVVARSAAGHWLVIRLSDRRAVAEVQGGEPFFVDSDRVLTVFSGRNCTRGDASLLDLRARTQRRIRLSGDKADLRPVAVDGGQIVAMRLQPGESSCETAGAARVDLDTGKVRTHARKGTLVASASGHSWLTDTMETKVLDADGRQVGSGPRIVATGIGANVVYVARPFEPNGMGIAPREPTPLRLGSGAGPSASDLMGDRLVEPQLIRPTFDERAVLVTHRGGDLPNGGHKAMLSICTVPQLKCRELLDVTSDFSRIAVVVPAAVLAS